MSEQMFNIELQFHAKLALYHLMESDPNGLLCCFVSLRLWDTLIILSLCALASLRLCVEAFALRGGSLPRLCWAMAKMPQRRIIPVLSPRLRHNGGCSRASRRFLWRKIRTTVALLVLPAAPFGDKFAFCATSATT